jgi:hypothetical protein
MTPLQLAIAWAVRAAMVALLAGLLFRRRTSACWSFLAYIVAVNAGALLVLLWPARFYTPEFWMVKQAVYDTLKVLIAIELAWRAVHAFPGAMRVARVWAAAGLILSTLVILLGPHPRELNDWWEWQPRTQIAMVWLMSLTGILVHWYRLPMRAWHRAILLGLAPYLVMFSWLADQLRRGGWGLAWWFGVLDAAAYLVLTCWWTYAAWRVERVPDGIPLALLRRLDMERA